ncbi:5' nucleotidase, NT5C type [Niabella ginsengisoli]|uniref:5'(3')-deoxyribonucleotidase n=1 Tax=Niabella ginsengisoli TaxID=522298 RepID=A0ABS9SQ69_9BACT|nr:5'(3')-deoxyribonucleotidase [Niabella ginsengisoli]MCH5600485.1 5'(3')-deoxyribonucleotidase [Niabella ginsengisoli]
MKKRIAVDMDGVLADCFEQFVNYEYAETGIRKTVEEGSGKTEDETFENARTYLYQPGFFRGMPVIANSQEVLYKLNERFEIFIVSAATEFPQSLPEKQAWLNEHFPFIKWQQMMFCGSKAIIDADVMIDDHFKNLDSFKGRTILFTQPHNELANAGKHKRVHNWLEIEHLLLNPQLYINHDAPADFSPAISKYA